MPGGKYRDYNPDREIPRSEPSADNRSLCHRIVAEANQKSLWVFDPSSKTWFTPNEFQDKYDRCRSGFEDFFAQCQVRNPTDGVIAGMTRIQRMQDQLTGFVNKVIGYYAKR